MVEPEVLAGTVPSGSNFILNRGWADTIVRQRVVEQLGSVHESLSSLEEVNRISSGYKRDGRMSIVRRCFCLLVLFDLLLISLLWLVCVMFMTSDSPMQIIKKQIIYCKITTSLFDIVLAACCRFTVLLLFYGLRDVNTRFFVAITTLGTCIFLIAKVIYYSWSTADHPAFQVVLVLASFIVAWTETWFLDFRVLPRELAALDYVQSRNRLSESLNTLLLERHLRDPWMLYLRRMTSEVGDPFESSVKFYSPLESPNLSDSSSEAQGSDSEKRLLQSVPSNQERQSQPRPEDIQARIERDQFLSRKKAQNGPKRDSEYVTWGRDTLDVAWSILNDRDWTAHPLKTLGVFVYSKYDFRLGRIFRLKVTEIKIPARRLLEELFENVEDFVQWNRTLLESRRVLVIDDHTDITYQVSVPGGNGMISSRDFVNLRHWDVKNDAFVIAGISVPHPSLPPNKKHVRGENGPCCWVMRPLPEDAGSCSFQFLLNTNLKGWVSPVFVESALESVLYEYADSLKRHCESIKSRTDT